MSLSLELQIIHRRFGIELLEAPDLVTSKFLRFHRIFHPDGLSKTECDNPASHTPFKCTFAIKTGNHFSMGEEKRSESKSEGEQPSPTESIDSQNRNVLSV